MSDLTTFRDHARRMATAEHQLECRGERDQHARQWAPLYVWPDPACAGCVTSADRVLWQRLADEADAYLARNTEEGLFT